MNINAFYPFIIPFAGECSEPIADQQIKHAIYDFFKDSTAWRDDLDAIPIVQGVTSYRLELPESFGNASINSVVKCKTVYSSTGETIRVLSYREISYDVLSCKLEIDSCLSNATNASLVPTVVIVPDLMTMPDDDPVPDGIMGAYSDAIIKKALSLILSLPGCPWFNAVLANYYEVQYQRLVGDAKFVKNNKGQLAPGGFSA